MEMMREIEKQCLLLEKAKLVAAITRGQHTIHRRVLEELFSFLVVGLHHPILKKYELF